VATETLAMSAVDTTSNWTNVGGADKVASVAADDGDTSYVQSNASNTLEQGWVAAASTAVGASDAISQIVISARAQRSAVTNVSLSGRLGVGASFTSVTSGSTFNGSYQTISLTYTTRPGGGSWTQSDVQGGLIVRLKNQASVAGTDIRVTRLTLVITYTPAPVGRAVVVRQAVNRAATY
jgi:hypothetical protein